MDKSMLETAKSLKEYINKDASTASLSLIDFADNYAITSHLQQLAIIYKLKYSKCTSDEQQNRVSDDMLKLIDDIVQDNKENIDSEIGRNLQETKNTLNNYFKDLSNQPAPKNVVFSCTNLGKTFKSSNFSLDNVSIELCLGKITSIVGENGNGKTTLFNLIAGELKHDSGRLAFPILSSRKKSINWGEVKSQIAYVPQELPQWDGSLKEMLHYEAAIHKVYGHKNKLNVNFIIERLGLDEHINKKWFELSGGFKLRFSLARALVWNPKLLLVDEPLASLDYKAQQIVLKDIRDLANGLKYPISVLISSQHIHEIEAVSDNLLFIENGKIIFNGATDDLGSTRKNNTFEFASPIPYEELRKKLKNLSYSKLYHNGFSYILSTSLQNKSEDVLQEFLNAKVEIKYFRDISRSVKQLFN